MPTLQSALGLVAFPVIAVLFSENFRKIRIKTVLAALALQLVLGLVLLKAPGARGLFLVLNGLVQ
ncbi:MAG: nucleoside:proton symporter, partial [Deltaproteobacteria bacterium]|nr:nucleoside:proton symporter [Deltaproteobacteria bacterium]